MFAWFGWFEGLGALPGGFSLFSLMQKLFGFGLAAILKGLVSFYSTVFHPIAEVISSGLHWVFALISIKLPHIPPDGAAYNHYAEERSVNKRDKSMKTFLLAIVIASGSLFGLSAQAAPVASATIVENKSQISSPVQKVHGWHLDCQQDPACYNSHVPGAGRGGLVQR
jgi:hypothetical protein